jgi:hypothetical protein
MKSKYKGVRWRKNEQKFVSSITVNGQKMNCGTSKDEREVARLRDLAILKYGLPVSQLQILKPKELQHE